MRTAVLAFVIGLVGFAAPAAADPTRGDRVVVKPGTPIDGDDPTRGDRVVVKPGTPIYGDAWDDRARGTVQRAREWTVTEVDNHRVLLERRSAGMIERIAVETAALGGSAEPVKPMAVAAVTIEDCRERGRCNFALEAGKRLDAYMGGDRAFLEATSRVAFANPVQVCKMGPLYELTIERQHTDWLAPAAAEWRPPLSYAYELGDTIEILAGTTPTEPPACAPRTRNANKIVIGGSGGKRPQMGLFALSPVHAKEVHARFDDSSKAAYDHAMKVATRKWAGDRTFCEDAVRQSLMFLGGSLDKAEKKRWRRLTFAAAKKRHWSTIVVRHAWMFREYEPRKCERVLRNYVEALRHTARSGDVLMNFGF